MNTDKIDLHYQQQLSAWMDGDLPSDEARVLLRRLDIRLDLCLIRGACQKAVVQMQVGQVFAHHLLQHIVGFMQHFLQMRGAFLIDGLGHK